MDEVFEIARGIRISGTINGPTRFWIGGSFATGTLRARSVVVAEGGSVSGLVMVEEADIAGLVDGSLTTEGTLRLRRTGKIVGVLRCRSLVVEPGAQIDALIRTAGHLPFPPPLSRQTVAA
ncbi:MAG TPA: polymer-forming cytoskeletal protein [Acidisphaera sp.]|nr:polymer-forming cytoskeletal protein [Acidisphaera sp.]